MSPAAPRLLVDTSSLLYRAFFALPRTIRDPQGQSVNAVRGYLDMSSLVITDRRPGSVVHVLDDDWRPAPRVAAHAGYKSARAEDPPELAGQQDLLLEVLAAAGCQVAWAAGWEADDAIATLAEAATAERPDEVLTGDRDLLQVVRDPAVRVLYTKQGVTRLAVFDDAAVLAAYGVPARLYAELAMLRGDPSDGLPGVAGIGTKGAARLLTEHGSLDALLGATATLTPRLRAALEGAAEYLAAMREVVPVRRELACEVTVAGTPDPERLRQLGERHAIASPVTRMLAALQTFAG
ncbi:MAG TPA: 5'-3' exonuclease H3TH domain-containing protein [Candidatus Dormibacteraeota bacterium]|nr:5'-3' exonuclease H3TH domain-containing protein [Candidatus Dormibacteraeota bacterium]